MSKHYDIYTDGACANNQGDGMQPGGWAAVFLTGEKFYGSDDETTNNRMEIKAVIEALKNTDEGSVVNIYSDSAYVINMFKEKWINNWEKNGFMTANKKKAVENQDLIKELRSLELKREVNFIKVKGHSGNEFNELADKLATSAISKEVKEKVNITFDKEKFIYFLNNIKALDDKSIEILSEIKKNIE